MNNNTNNNNTNNKNEVKTGLAAHIVNPTYRKYTKMELLSIYIDGWKEFLQLCRNVLEKSRARNNSTSNVLQKSKNHIN